MLLTSCHSAYCSLQQARRPSVFGSEACTYVSSSGDCSQQKIDLWSCRCAHFSNRRTPASQGARHSARRRVQQHQKQIVCAAGAAIKDPYKVLGIPSSADTQAIKKAFKKKAKELHPDVNHAVTSLVAPVMHPTAHKKMHHMIDANDRLMLQPASWKSRWHTSC